MASRTPRRYAGDAEVVAEDRDTGRADVADLLLDLFELLLFLWSVKQHVVPLGRVEVFDCMEDQPMFGQVRLDGQ